MTANFRKKTRVDHEVILASAGCGKTFALTTRIIRLVCLGVRPERIIALTFSRKAAGEIFDTLITRLAHAAATPAAAAALARLVAVPGLDCRGFGRILADLLAHMHLSPIGTLDSFFVRVVRTFPFELGVSGDFAVTDQHFMELEQAGLLRHILQPYGDVGAQRGRTEFLEAFKRATFGREEKRLGELLAAFVQQYHEAYLATLGQCAWGDPACIWPDGGHWQPLAPEGAVRAAKELRRELVSMAAAPRQIDKWEAFIRMAENFTPYSVVDEAAKDVFAKLLAIAPDMEAGAATITVYRKMNLTETACRCASALLHRVVATLIAGQIESTRGLADILERYERAYDARLRRVGKMSFADVQFLLARQGRGDDTPAGPLGGDIAAAEARRAYVDYRLDGFYDHWALDEFQDTSWRQWQVIKNLVDEIVQDVSGQRSFFAVADVKQAIHGWRGGDSALLREIVTHYNRTETRIQTRPLAQSWRSCTPVITAVNRALAPARLRQHDLLPEPVVARWDLHWEIHSSAPPLRQLQGYAALFQVASTDPTRRAGEEERFALMAEMLQAMDLPRRGWSVAVLVRSNRTGRKAVEFLRRQGIAAAWDGDFPITDNPVVAAFLALLKVAHHPGDSFAWQHVLMTPLRKLVPQTDDAARAAFVLQLMTELSNRGIEPVLDAWLNRLGECVELDAFSLGRMADLLAVARDFDAAGNRSVVDFIELAESVTVGDMVAAESVRVLTMHKSKGLGFDAVILPDLQYGGITSAGQIDLAVRRQRNADRRAEWVLRLPPRPVALADPVLRDYVEACDQDSCFEELCLLYVALTRAKRGLYVITSKAGESSRATYLATVLEACMGAVPKQGPVSGNPDVETRLLYETGSPDWYRQAAEPPAAAAEPPAAAAGFAPAGSQRRRYRRRLPSAEPGTVSDAAELFIAHSSRARQIGSAVHALFQQIDWIDDGEPWAPDPGWRAAANVEKETAETAELIVRRALASEAVKEVLSKPAAAPCELWREKSFEAILDDEWVSGVFDRVVIERDAEGNVEAAQITDFKSLVLTDDKDLQRAVERYQPQLTLYRRALAQMLGVRTERLQATLLFTHTGQTVPLPPA